MVCVRFSHVRMFFDSRNVQERATKSDISGHCLLETAGRCGGGCGVRVGSRRRPGRSCGAAGRHQHPDAPAYRAPPLRAGSVRSHPCGPVSLRRAAHVHGHQRTQRGANHKHRSVMTRALSACGVVWDCQSRRHFCAIYIVAQLCAPHRIGARSLARASACFVPMTPRRRSRRTATKSAQLAARVASNLPAGPTAHGAQGRNDRGQYPQRRT